MTTIATDGKTIAADGKRCSGNEIIDLGTKKIIVRSGRIFAFTGTSGLFEAAIQWYLSGAEAEKAPKVTGDDSWRLLVICGGRELTAYGHTAPHGETYPYPQAFGSGCAFAQAAMLCGKSPAEAIRLASELDVFTGGKIQVVNIEEALTTLPLAQAAE